MFRGVVVLGMKNTFDMVVMVADCSSHTYVMSSSTNDQIHAPQEQKHVTPVTIAVDLLICAAFFGFMFGKLRGHVPSSDPFFQNVFGAATTVCLTGVVWMAIQMFRVVVAGEKRLKAARAGK